MFKLKKIVSLVLVAVMVTAISTTTFAKGSDDYEKKLKVDIEAFELEMKETGYEYAEKNGLLMSVEEMEAMTKAMESAGSAEEKHIAFKNYEKYSISDKTIYNYKTELKTKAKDILKKYPTASGIISSDSMSTLTTPTIGDYRAHTTYSYTEQTNYDTRNASNYTTLQQIAVNIIALGLKPAAGIAVAVLTPVMGSSSLPTSCTNYEMKSTYHTCLTVKWGQVYSGGGLFGSTDWYSYSETQRLDTFAKMNVDSWYSNKFYTNSKSAQVKYQYNEYYYNSTYIKDKALEKYKYQMDNYYTILYGVGVPIPEYNMTYHTTWTSSSSNPFQ